MDFFSAVLCCTTAVLVPGTMIRPALVQGGTVVDRPPSPHRSLTRRRSPAVARRPSFARRRSPVAAAVVRPLATLVARPPSLAIERRPC